MAITTTTLPRWAFPANSIDNHWSYGSVYQGASGGTTNATWPAANKIIYQPVTVLSTVKVLKMWFGSSTVGTDTCEMGVYTRAGIRVTNLYATGAKTAAFSEKVFDVTDTTIGAGLYYLALQCASATATFRVWSFTAPVPAAIGVRTETPGGMGLPSDASSTWAVDSTQGGVPMLGMYLESTPT